MTQTALDEFERGFAERSGTTVEQLRAWGRFAERCDCGEIECEGWAMGAVVSVTRKQIHDVKKSPPEGGGY